VTNGLKLYNYKLTKNIILGDGQKLLSPERRFDAFIVSHPELFEK